MGGAGASKAGYATPRPTQSDASLSRDGLGANPLASDATSVATQRDITENGSTPGADSDHILRQMPGCSDIGQVEAPCKGHRRALLLDTKSRLKFNSACSSLIAPPASVEPDRQDASVSALDTL